MRRWKVEARTCCAKRIKYDIWFGVFKRSLAGRISEFWGIWRHPQKWTNEKPKRGWGAFLEFVRNCCVFDVCNVELCSLKGVYAFSIQLQYVLSAEVETCKAFSFESILR